MGKEKKIAQKWYLGWCKFVNERACFFNKLVMDICFWASFLFAPRSRQRPNASSAVRIKFLCRGQNSVPEWDARRVGRSGLDCVPIRKLTESRSCNPTGVLCGSWIMNDRSWNNKRASCLSHVQCEVSRDCGRHGLKSSLLTHLRSYVLSFQTINHVLLMHYLF